MGFQKNTAVWVACLWLATVVHISESDSQGNANQYIDQVVQNIREDIRSKSMDPMRLDDFDNCKDCWLEGLSTIYRSGDASLSTRDDLVILGVNLGAGEIKARCYCSKRFGFIKVGGHLWARLRHLNIFGRISQSMEDENVRNLEEFTLTNEGDLDIGVSGGGIQRLINEAIIAIFRGRIKSRIRSEIRDKLPEMARNAIQSNDVNINF